MPKELFFLNRIQNILVLDELSNFYLEDATVCVQIEFHNRFEFLGRISDVRIQKKEIDIPCEDLILIRKYKENQMGKIVKCRVIDFGIKARLNRQNAAMKKLFLDESANSHMKDIISGEFDWKTPKKEEVLIEDTIGLFGSNIRQKEAYVGAINAPDIFMIQGPPGTGKTTIITELVRYAIGKGQKVLVSSETNIAVDNVLERIRHTENVIPVRLGRKERIEECGRQYMPEEIGDTILQKIKEENEFLNQNGVNQEVLIEKCQKSWYQKELLISKEIERLTSSLNVVFDYKKLLEKIQKFENLVLEINEQHEWIQKEKETYFLEKKKLLQLEEQKANIEEQIALLSDNSMSSGFRKDKKESYNKRQALLLQLQEILLQIEHCNNVLSRNRYEVLTASYKRKVRRYEKAKTELENIVYPSNSIIAKVHQMKGILEDIVTLEHQIEKLRVAREEEIKAIRVDCERKEDLWRMTKDIREQWMEAIEDHTVKEDIERIYMKRTNVVFSTCTGIAASDNGSFADMEYDYVIIDEAAKCNMLDLLIPVTMGKKVILVGDHKQLYPMIETEGITDEITEEQIRELKEHILFRWLYEENIPSEYKIMLNRQYRMERTISNFVSDRFYGGNLICDKDKENPFSMIWIDCEDSKEVCTNPSFQNPKEANVIILLLNRLDKEYKKGTAVGIICTYKAQANYIRNLMKDMSWNNIEVECSTVDAFQGKEKHTIIFNIVRSKELNEFVKDENRVNVAISRTQEFLFIVGNAELMKRKNAGILKELYEYVRKNGNLYNSNYVR